MKCTGFLHVDEYVPLETEHPFQGAWPYLKLVWQPSTQLPVVLASLASFAASDIDDDKTSATVDDVWDLVLPAAA